MNGGQKKRLQKKVLDLKSKALAERARRYYPFASDYVSTIRILREEKGKTWDEVRDFFLEEGLDFSVQSMISAFKRARPE